jgi:hypothetical protein
MRGRLSTAAVLTALASSTAVAPSSAPAAPGAGAFYGTVHIDCFGCGDSDGYGDWCWWYIVLPDGRIICLDDILPPWYNTHATFTVHESPGAECAVSGTADGVMTGAVNGGFTWARVGAFAVITTTGDVNGSGVMSFVVTSPAGLPCGSPVTANVAGEVHGT